MLPCAHRFLPFLLSSPPLLLSSSPLSSFLFPLSTCRLAAKRQHRETQKQLADDYAQRLAALQKERASARAARRRSSSRKSRRSERN